MVSPTVIGGVHPIPAAGYVFDNTTAAPGNMTGNRNDKDQSFLYTLAGTGAGNIWGTDTYTVDSPLAAAVVHAGVLVPGENGAVRVTVKPGQGSYYGSNRFDVTSNFWGPYDSSYTIERYEPAVPSVPDGLYPRLWIGFSEEIDTSTLALRGSVTLTVAGPNGIFGNGNDSTVPVSFDQFT